MQTLTSPVLIGITLSTAFGLLMHDTQLDRATTVALTAPAALITYAAADFAMKSSDHIHVEKASGAHDTTSLRAITPRTPPRDDDRRYVQSKKAVFNGGNSSGLWPSV